jgi:TonB family protein
VNRAVHRFSQRQGFLVSAIVHLSFLMLLMSGVVKAPEPAPEEAPSPPPPSARVFIPPPAVLRELRPTPAPAAPRRDAKPEPPPTPIPNAKDRMSIGPPSTDRTREPLILRRDQDLTNQAPRGRPDGVPSPIPAAPTPEPPRAAAAAGSPEAPGQPGLRLPPGLGRDLRSGAEGSRARPGAPGPIATAARNIERRLAQAPLGVPSGIGNPRQMGPLLFDPQGADFTAWVNHFKNEVYRNWILPKPAEFGFRGHVDFEFTVERDGSLTDLKMLLSSGTAALDRAAQNALTSSRFVSLPSDYGPPRIVMRVSFFYNESPQPS